MEKRIPIEHTRVKAPSRNSVRIANAIKAQRLRLKITQAEAARLFNIVPPQYVKMERGGSIPHKVILDASALLGIDYEAEMAALISCYMMRKAKIKKVNNIHNELGG